LTTLAIGRRQKLVATKVAQASGLHHIP